MILNNIRNYLEKLKEYHSVLDYQQKYLNLLNLFFKKYSNLQTRKGIKISFDIPFHQYQLKYNNLFNYFNDYLIRERVNIGKVFNFNDINKDIGYDEDYLKYENDVIKYFGHLIEFKEEMYNTYIKNFEVIRELFLDYDKYRKSIDEEKRKTKEIVLGKNNENEKKEDREEKIINLLKYLIVETRENKKVREVGINKEERKGDNSKENKIKKVEINIKTNKPIKINNQNKQANQSKNITEQIQTKTKVIKTNNKQKSNNNHTNYHNITIPSNSTLDDNLTINLIEIDSSPLPSFNTQSELDSENDEDVFDQFNTERDKLMNN
jgi:hypothetical protein